MEPQMQWNKNYLGVGGLAIQTSDGGYALAATNASITFYPASERAPVIIRTDASGEVQWNKTFETGNAGVNSIIQTIDGGFAISGSNIAAPAFQPVYSGWRIKLDSQGNVQWNKTFESLERCVVIQASDNGYVLIGIRTNSVTSTDVVFFKTDSEGNVLWDKTQTFTGESPHPFLMDLVESRDGNYVVAGSLGKEFWLMKTDVDGGLLWNKTYNPANSDKPHSFRSISNTKDGGFILVGMGGGEASLQGSVAGSNDGDFAWLIKVDSEGNTEWSHDYLSSIAGFSSAIQTSDGGYAAVGSRDMQALLVRTDASGSLLYSACYGDKAQNSSSFASVVLLTSDGGFAVSGGLNNYSPTSAEGFRVTPWVGDNVWLAKFAHESNGLQNNNSFDNSFLFIAAIIGVVLIVTVSLLLGLIKFRRKIVSS
jgi:hypothetical protein